MTHHQKRQTSISGLKRDGFTLTELLVVMVVLTILAAVLIPNLRNAQNSSSSKNAQLHGQAVNLAVRSYVSSRPGLSMATLMNASGWGATKTENGVSGKNCANNVRLSGGASAPQVTPGTAPSGSGWGAPGDSKVMCLISDNTSTADLYDFNVQTWSSAKQSAIYVNGVKK